MLKDQNTEWKIENKWQYFNLSPYDETIVLDSDMLFFHDISLWWEYLKDSDLEFTTHTVNYTGEKNSNYYYRKVFDENSLPNIHTALFYFKKTEENKRMFDYTKLVFENWRSFYEKLLKNPPKFVSGDVVFAIAAKVLFNRNWDNELKFTHMRNQLQHPDMFTDWFKTLPVYFSVYDNNKINLKVHNFNQMYPFHYINKDFLKREVVELYEEKALSLF
jgi:hypothetical protein